MDNPTGSPSSVPPPGGAQPPPAWEPAPAPQGPGWLKTILDARASYAFLAAALVLFFVCKQEANVGLFGVIPDGVARKYGAYHYHDVRDQGEWWRFFTTLFVSRMGLDALIYLMIFAQLGPQLERMLGTARFCVLYLGAGAGGVAIAELVDPSTRLQFGVGDTIVAVYAALGAIPGVILGTTGSLAATVRSPEARSAVFWVGFWSIIRYASTNRLEPAVLGAAALAIPLGAGLALSKRDLVKGLASAAVPALAVAALIGLVCAEKRLQDGKLVDRGRPATGRLPGPGPAGDGATEAPPPSALEPAEASSEAVAEAREQVDGLLGRFGPLPKQFGYTLDEQGQARALLADVNKVVNGPNTVMGELDAERARLNIVLANFNEADRIAGELLALKPSPYARALAGLTAYYRPNLERAEDHLEQATQDARFVLELPEALFYYAKVVEERHGLEAAAGHYERYARTIGDGPHPAWRKPLADEARRKLGR